MDYYIEMLRKCIARIEADFEFSAIIDHNASKGTFREQIVQKFLRPFYRMFMACQEDKFLILMAP